MIGQGRNAAAVLTVDLDAIRSNYRLLQARAGQATCAAVLKADAYGLGAARVAPVLLAEKCRHFFVAHLDEGIALRPLLPADAELFVLHGPVPGSEQEFLLHDLTPVLNSAVQIAGWTAFARRIGRTLPAIVQVDTGMSRLGLPAEELLACVEKADFLATVSLRFVMSHLACAENQAHPMNAAQLAAFRDVLLRFPACGASLANSSGIFLGPDFHFDLVRPGAALFGIAPVTGAPNPLQPVVRLQASIIQVQSIKAGQHVGYGATYCAPQERRIATIAAGYADGWLRSLSGHGFALIDGQRAALVGMVSMDTCALDVTGIAPDRLHPGMMVDLIGPGQTVDAVAELAGTIGYEILTSLGSRYRRDYLSSAEIGGSTFAEHPAAVAI